MKSLILLLALFSTLISYAPPGISSAQAGTSMAPANVEPVRRPQLTILDQEVHYALEPPAALSAARPVPVPAKWDSGVGGIGNAAIIPSTLIDVRGELMSVYSSASPNFMMRYADGRMVQFALVTGVGQYETLAGVNNQQLWYRISLDAGETFSNFYPMIEDGHDATCIFPGIYVGTNGLWNSVSPIIEMSNGEIAVPVSYWPLDQKNVPIQPRRRVTSFSVNAVIIGSWNDTKTDLSWTLSDPVAVPEALSSRGAIEPAIAELAGRPGHLMMVSRASNESAPELISRYWVSRSTDYGRTWNEPTPFCYADGDCFFGASAASTLVRAHNGGLYWIGNILDKNPDGNLPRYPLHIGLVDETRLAIVRDTVLVLDNRNPIYDTDQVQLAGVTSYVDPLTSSMVIYLQRFDPGLEPRFTESPPYNWYRVGFMP